MYKKIFPSRSNLKKSAFFISKSYIGENKIKQKLRGYETMVVSKNILEKNLALEYQDGLDKKGKAIIKKAIYKNVKLTAEPEEIRIEE